MDKQLFWAIIVILLALVIGGLQLQGAADCAAKGGRYITGNNIPVCVQEMK